VIAVLAVVALALAGCGGSNGGSSDGASAAGVSLTPPPGWQVKDDGDRGLVLAPDPGDLSATVVEGPRFTAKPATGEAPDRRALVR
jgi:hypothetical protein